MKTIIFAFALTVGVLFGEQPTNSTDAVVSSPTSAAPVESGGDAAQNSHLQAAQKLIKAGKSDEALRLEIDPALKFFEEKYSRETRKVYCARTSAESLAYLVESASKSDQGEGGGSSVVIGSEWVNAYFMKAYVLVEHGQISEARTNLMRALALSPNNSQCLCELAHLYQREKNWMESQKLYVKAAECAPVFSPNAIKTMELTRALRGQGYNLVEMGKLDEAEAKYQECLKLDQNDQKAQAELKYVNSLKEKTRGTEGK